MKERETHTLSNSGKSTDVTAESLSRMGETKSLVIVSQVFSKK